MNNEHLTYTIWQYSVVAAAVVVLYLVVRLVSGLLFKNGNVVKSSIKYLINSISFLFVYVVYLSFFLVVQAPHGKTRDQSIDNLNRWIRTECVEWSFWGLLLTSILFMFNRFYQARIENIKDTRQLVFLAILDLMVMAYGIVLGSYQALFGLMEEIDRHTY